MLVSTAVRSIAVTSLYDGLAAGRVSPEVHVALDHELALNDDRQRIVRMLKTERANTIDAMPGFSNGGPQPPRLVVYLFGWNTKSLFAGSLDYLDDAIASTAQRSHSGPQGVEHHQVADTSGHGVMAELMTPIHQAFFDADARNTAMVRALRIFNALRVFAEKNGREANGTRLAVRGHGPNQFERKRALAKGTTGDCSCRIPPLSLRNMLTERFVESLAVVLEPVR